MLLKKVVSVSDQKRPEIVLDITPKHGAGPLYWRGKLYDLLQNTLLNYEDGFRFSYHALNDGLVRVVICAGYVNYVERPHDESNILYRIANESTPFSKDEPPLYKNARYFVTEPKNHDMSVHYLVISRHAQRHIGDLSRLDWSALGDVVQYLTKELGLKEFRLDMNTKKAQAIPQFHMHVLSGKDGEPYPPLP